MADSEWVDVTDQHVNQAKAPAGNDAEWVDVTDQHAGKPNANFADKLIGSSGVSPSYQRIMKATKDQTETPQGVQQLATQLLPGSASVLTKGAGALGRVGVAGLQAGTSGVAMGDQDAPIMDKLSRFGKSAALGSAVQGGTEAAGAVQNKIADWLMQKATGQKKFVEGLGNQLVDEGVFGLTRGGLKNNVAGKIASRGQELDQAVSQIPGEIDSGNVAKQVGGLADRYTGPGGVIPQAVQPEVNAVTSRAQDIASRGNLSPADALKYKRIAGLEGYKDGTPLASFNANLAKTENAGYGSALENAYAKANPEVPNAVANSNSSLSALYKAQKGLSKAPSMSTPLAEAVLALGGLGLGAASDHDNRAGGAIKGLLLSQALKSKGLQSGGAQLLQKSSSALTDPRSLQALLNALGTVQTK